MRSKSSPRVLSHIVINILKYSWPSEIRRILFNLIASEDIEKSAEITSGHVEGLTSFSVTKSILIQYPLTSNSRDC